VEAFFKMAGKDSSGNIFGAGDDEAQAAKADPASALRKYMRRKKWASIQKEC